MRAHSRLGEQSWTVGLRRPVVQIKNLIKQLTPPILLDCYRTLRRHGKKRRREWEYIPEGWRVLDPNIKGWNVASVVDTYLRQWTDYVTALRGPAAIRGYYGGTSNESVSY